jgi:PKD repeat protein
LKLRLRRTIAPLLAVVALVTLTPRPSLAVQTDSPLVVNADPVDYTPHVLDGKVEAIVQVGNTVYVGGLFTQVRTASDPTVISRINIFAFDANTGAIDTSFVPAVDGEVTTLAASGDGTAVFIGGLFTKVNNVFSKAVAKVNRTTGQLVPGFTASASARVMHLTVNGNRLFIGGFFTTVNNTPRTALAALNATTGALDSTVNLAFTGPRKSGGTPHVLKFDVTPDGSKLIAIGNFTFVDGQRRDQVVVIDLPGTAAVSSWATTRYQQNCSSSFETYMRDIDISPDGAFFGVVTTGAYFAGSLCDTASRWETASTGAGQQPTWVDYTGGDTLFSVAITTGSFYVGGHQRWVNNAFAGDRAGPGAIARDGIAALDPQNGLPFSWNPGRTRGVGAFELTVTPKGLYVGSDTDRLGNMEYHGRVALLPLAGGTAVPPNVATALPADLYMAGPTGSGFGSTTLRRSRVNTTGVLPSIRDTAGNALDWSVVRGAFMVNGRLYTAQSDGKLYERDFNGVTLGAAREVNLNGLTSTQLPLSSLTGMFYAQNRVYYTRSSDSNLYWRWFLPESEVLGAEVFTASAGTSWSTRGIDYAAGRIYYVTSNGDLWSMALVNGVPSGATAALVDNATDWRSRDLLFFNGPSGAARPNAAPVPNVSQSCTGLSCTYDGSTSTDADGAVVSFQWSFSDGASASGASVSHTWASGGTKTATLTVADDSGTSATKTVQFAVTNPADAPPQAAFTATCDQALGCHFDGSGSTDPDGTITGAAWAFGDGTTGTGLVADHVYAAAGTYNVTLTVTDDQSASASKTTAVTVAPPTNPKPTAVIAATCTDRTCTFDGSGSSDSNGTISSYAWSFGDGTSGTGVSASHVYAANGTYTATLTVTDNGGATGTASTQVKVAIVAFRGTTTAFAFADVLSIKTPSSVQSGDALLLFLTMDNATSTVTPPNGWSEVNRVTDDTMRTVVWSKVAGAGDANTTVTVAAGAKVHANLMTMAYSGTSPTAPVLGSATAAESTTQAAHASPGLTTSVRAWVLTFTADLSTTTVWTKGALQRVRGEAYGTDTPHLSVLVSERTATAAPGAQPQVTTTANTSSGTATMMTIALAPNA